MSSALVVTSSHSTPPLCTNFKVVDFTVFRGTLHISHFFHKHPIEDLREWLEV